MPLTILAEFFLRCEISMLVFFCSARKDFGNSRRVDRRMSLSGNEKER